MDVFRERETNRIIRFRQMKPVHAFLLAFTVAIVFVLEIRNSPLFLSPVVDAYTYDQAARAIARSGIGSLEVPFYQPPFYPLFLGGLHALTGGDPLFPRLANCVLHAGTAALIFMVGRSLGGTVAGASAATLFALYGLALYFVGELLPVSLLLFLQTASLALLLTAARSPRPGLMFAVIGILLGIAAITRPTSLFLLGAAGIWWIAVSRSEPAQPSPEGSKTASRAHRIAGPLLLGITCAAAAILPVTVANGSKSSEIILVSWNGGLNLYLGNGGNADSLVAIQPGAAWERLQRRPRRADVTSPASESGYWTQRTLHDIAADPAGWGASFGRKAVRFLAARETPRNTDWESFRPDSRVLSLPLPTFGWVAALGLWALLRKRFDGNGRLLLGLWMACALAQNLIFFVAERYRIEAVPALCVCAGMGVADLGNLIRRTRRPSGKALLVPLCGVALFVAISGFDWLHEWKIDRTRESIHRGVALRRLERNDEAEREFSEAIRISPRDPDAHRWLGEIALGRKKYDVAIQHFDAALGEAPDYIRPLLGRAQALEEAGRGEEAEPAYRKALESDPWSTDVHLNYGVWLAKRSRLDEAEQLFRRALQLNPNDGRVQRNLTRLTEVRRTGQATSRDAP